MVENEEVCLKINGKQTVKLKSSLTEFKNYSRQIPAPFKIYANFDFCFKKCKKHGKTSGFYTKKYQDHIPCNFAYKIICVDDKFSKLVVLYRSENVTYKFIKMMLEEFGYCKKVMKKHLNKNLI